jgi:hypothetical protein
VQAPNRFTASGNLDMANASIVNAPTIGNSTGGLTLAASTSITAGEDFAMGTNDILNVGNITSTASSTISIPNVHAGYLGNPAGDTEIFAGGGSDLRITGDPANILSPTTSGPSSLGHLRLVINGQLCGIQLLDVP